MLSERDKVVLDPLSLVNLIEGKALTYIHMATGAGRLSDNPF